MRLCLRMSEGDVREAPEGDSYYGSTMFSIDLMELQRQWRGPLDRDALRNAVEGSVRVRLRLMRLAVADAKQRVPERIWGTSISETRVYLKGDALQMDVDVEAPLDAEEPATHGADHSG